MYVTVMCWCMYFVCNCEIADVRLLYMCFCMFGCESVCDVCLWFVKESVWCVCVFANVRVFVRMCECLSESAGMGVPVSESVCGVYMSVRVSEYTCG